MGKARGLVIGNNRLLHLNRFKWFRHSNQVMEMRHAILEFVNSEVNCISWQEQYVIKKKHYF